MTEMSIEDSIGYVNDNGTKLPITDIVRTLSVPKHASKN